MLHKMGIWHMACYQTIPHAAFISIPTGRQYWQFSFSLLLTLFNRRGNNSICCTWLDPGMRNLWMMSLPGIWPLKSSCNSHGTARRELQWEQQIHKAATVKQSRAAKTACKVIFKWPEVVSTTTALATTAKWDEFISDILSFLLWHSSTSLGCPRLEV